jgi:hypothetical protein
MCIRGRMLSHHNGTGGGTVLVKGIDVALFRDWVG